MNIILLDKEDFMENGSVLLKDRRAEHIINVLKPDKAQIMKVGLVNGNIGEGRFIREEDGGVMLEVNNFSAPPSDPIPATLILAMQRPKTLRKIIQSATAMGVKKFYIIESWKVEKGYWNSPLLLPENLDNQFRLGLEQAGDTQLPEIFIRKRFKPFVEDELSEVVADSLGFIAHPYASSPCPYQINKQATIAVGPEGGFTDYEIEKMVEAGMKPVSLGERILRSEFAVTAILAKLF